MRTVGQVLIWALVGLF